MTPQQSIERECARRGRADVIAGCRSLVRGEHVDPDLLLALGGPAARKFLDGDVHADTYWLRVWGARGLLWVWDDAATAEILLALSDPAWRVREMALKVIARQRMGDLITEVAAVRNDPVPRVRQAADRALTLLTASGA
jgi:HEAT repeat protein